MDNGNRSISTEVTAFKGETVTASVDPVFFADLAALDPKDVCRRALCRYDAGEERYEVPVWGEDYRIFPGRSKVEGAHRSGPGQYDYLALVAVHYLLGAKAVEPAGQWVSEKDIPGGAAFFRGPHQVPTHRISARFENDLEGFRNRCTELQGRPLDMGDAAYGFDITSRIPAAVLYWVGDEDFPAEARILYDNSISKHLALDAIYALAVGICERLGMAGPQHAPGSP